MTRLPKKRGITQVEEDKSLILLQNVGNPPEDSSDENSYAELDDPDTIPDVPINKGYLTKITAERARRDDLTLSLPQIPTKFKRH